MSSEFSEKQEQELEQEQEKTDELVQDAPEEEIEFDDELDINQLQEKLKEHMAGTGIEYEIEKPEETSVSPETETETETDKLLSSGDNEEEIKNFVDSLNGTEMVEQTENVLEPVVKDEPPRVHLGEKKYVV